MRLAWSRPRRFLLGRFRASGSLRPAAVALSAAAAVAGFAAAPARAYLGAPDVHISANQFVDGVGQPFRLLGVNRSGTEYECVQAPAGPDDRSGIWYGPYDGAAIAAMLSWHINSVRLHLNEDCWLGLNGAPKHSSAARYRAAIIGLVDRMHAAGLVVILDLHWAAPGSMLADGQRNMADRDHSIRFWSSVATTFKRDSSIVFDLFNEPVHVSWSCLRAGCRTSAACAAVCKPRPTRRRYRTASMQELVDAVRSTGAAQPLLIAGPQFAQDLSRWGQFAPHDRVGQLAASFHVYVAKADQPIAGDCREQCWDATVAPVAARVPVVTGEFGESDCQHGFIDRYMSWADAHGVSYIGFGWNLFGCGNGPDLIRDWAGDPTPYGIGLRDHLASLAAAGRPAS